MPIGGVGLFGWLSAIWKLISDRIPFLGANTAANAIPVTLATDGIFATFAGLASDAASITGSIHAKLRSVATTLQSILTAIPSTTNPVLVRNISNKFREDFAGSSLSSTVWQTIQTGAGQTITVSNSEL
ncbi:hypothetical protein LC653_35700 [Nostoc sp. CHAB 5784]|uniref:hypothetical protein n=1 Tax=Nostoc mirabile TaxID=2907820 RepID=UPI001E494E62|nr:hypothetical protein [Nostoc mirabile]MCC5669063.1 hypothetical protein [Nostoc mirabile CHAB5784]